MYQIGAMGVCYEIVEVIYLGMALANKSDRYGHI
jgi:hypothetical protein|tara:strand:- start:6520 stop:6621 length:102 start_codon:yes stop_codon:yes gene_type:complete